MIKIYKVLVFISVTFLMSSCGVIFGGSKYSASVIARNRPDVTVSLNNGMNVGKGNAMGVFMRKDPLVVNVTAPDCLPQTWYFNPKIRTGNLILTILGFGITGVIVDMVTGACYQPNFKGDPMIQRVSRKEFVFSVDYRGCRD
jgi:hypothetical protein